MKRNGKAKAATPSETKAGIRFNLFYRRSKTTALAGQQMQSFFYVYILVSEANEMVHFTGRTRDLGKRLLEHNQGKSPPIAQNRTWRIETAVAFRSEGKPRAFDRYLGSGGEFARRHF